MIVELAAKKNFIVSFLIFTTAAAIAYYTNLSQPLWLRLGSIALVWIFLFFLQQIAPLYKASLGSENLAAFFFVFLVPSTNTDIKSLILSLLIVYGFVLILKIFESKHEPSDIQIFNISLIFATAAAFSPVLFILILLLFYVFHQRARNLLIILIAYIFIFYMYFAVDIFLFKATLTQAWNNLVSWHIVSLANFKSYLWIFLLIMFTITSVYALGKMTTETIKNRKILWTTILLFVLSLSINFFTGTRPITLILFSLVLLLSYFFYDLETKKWIKDILFLAIIILSITFSLGIV